MHTRYIIYIYINRTNEFYIDRAMHLSSLWLRTGSHISRGPAYCPGVLLSDTLLDPHLRARIPDEPCRPLVSFTVLRRPQAQGKSSALRGSVIDGNYILRSAYVLQ